MYAPFQPSSLPSTHIQTKYRARACVCVCYDVRADMVLFPGGVAERTPQAFVPGHHRKRPACLRAAMLMVLFGGGGSRDGERQVFDRTRPFDGKETVYHGNGAQVLGSAQVRQEVHQNLLCGARSRKG